MTDCSWCTFTCVGYLVLALVSALLAWIYVPHITRKFAIDTGSDDNKNTAKQGFGTGKLIPKDVDVIVIGSGMGGLTTAAMLAKEGQKVLVLEQHDQAGGNLHVFEEEGFEFDTGLHYIGGNVGSKTSPLRKLFDYVTDSNVEWAALDAEYDICVLKEEHKQARRFPFRASSTRAYKESKAQLYTHFPAPEDCKAIDEFFRLCDQVMLGAGVNFVGKLLPAYARKGLFALFSTQMTLFSKTTHTVLSELTNNKELIGCLEYLWGDYGSSPKTSSFGIHAMVFLHFAYKGAFYPVGGPAKLAFELIRCVERRGGKVLVRAPVTSILCENGIAVGVVVKGKHEIRAKRVVSSVGLTLTGTLLPPLERKIMQPVLNQALHPDIKQNFSLSSVFVGIEGKDLNLPAHNLWLTSSFQHDEAYQKFRQDTSGDPELPMCFISFSSAKDPTYHARIGANKHACLVVTGADWNHWEPHEYTKYGKRSSAYEQQKALVLERCLDALYAEYPQLKGKVTYTSVGTPLSNNHFLGNYQGAIYGLQHTPERMLNLITHPKTDIPGLYLTGQDTATCGIVGGALSGIQTASIMEPRSFFRKAWTFLG